MSALPINFDPSTLTKSEIDILQRLAERRDQITAREREMEAKEGLLKAVSTVRSPNCRIWKRTSRVF